MKAILQHRELYVPAVFYYKTAMLLPFMHEFHPFMQSGLIRDFYPFMFVSGINNTGGIHQINNLTRCLP